MVSSRREMLRQAARALTGLASIGCGLVSPALAQAPGRRREVVVTEKRVRTVDLHAHCHVAGGERADGVEGAAAVTRDLAGTDQGMDEQGIDVEALSLNPIFWYKAEPDLAGQVVKLQNEKLAEICAAQPDRFVGLASVALQHPDLAAEQLEHAVKGLGLRGALIGGTSTARSYRIPNSIRSGQGPKSSTW